MTEKYGLPYYQNFVNSDLTPGMVSSMYYSLQFDLRELLKGGNSLLGSTEQTGSIGVVTLNCAHLEYLYKGDWVTSFFEALHEIMIVTCYQHNFFL